MKNKKNENEFLRIWEDLESRKKKPLYARKLIIKDYNEFAKEVFYGNYLVKKKLAKSLYEGDVYILKKAFTKKFCNFLIKGSWKINKKEKQSFHKMKENCPNFHRLIDSRIYKKYSANHLKHSFYFFPWNQDPLNMFNKIYKKWRAFKYLGGFKYNEYEDNTPKDGVVDRFQIVHYPTGAGWLETHQDPYHNQRFIISGFLSERGRDYKSGGFYYYKRNRKIIDCDYEIETGDMLTSYATVLHGVSQIDYGKKIDYNSPKGRWFLGLYSNDSDHLKKRKTQHSFGKKYPTPFLPVKRKIQFMKSDL